MTNEELKKLFIKEVHAAARGRYAVEVFADMVRAMAICFEAPLALGERHEELEKEYAQIKGRYTEDEFVHFPIALAMVQMALERHREDGCQGIEYTPGKIISLSDPSCGSSVLLIEGAEKLLADGVRQADILIQAGDIDGRACDISYVQLSLLGYAAVVQHMDALAMRRISPDRFTPGYYLHCMPMRRVAA